MIIKQTLTEELAQRLCEAIIPSDIREILAITLSDHSKIEFHQQFFCKYEGQPLRYSETKTKIHMAMIYNYANQDIYKLKLLKNKVEELNDPENFHLMRMTKSNNYMSGGNISSETMTGSRGDKALLLSKTDSLSNEIAHSLGRTGSSALNEDFSTVEEDWVKRDKLTETKRQTAQITDIKVTDSEEGEINLDTIKVTPQTESQSLRETLEETPLSTPQVSYTDLSINKSISNVVNDNIVSGKNLNNAKVSVSVNKNNVITNMQGTDARTIAVEFTKNETTYKALSIYASNFRESFLNSFYCLFESVWNGY